MILKLSDCSALWGAAPLRRAAGLAKHGCRRLLCAARGAGRMPQDPRSGGVGVNGHVTRFLREFLLLVSPSLLLIIDAKLIFIQR